MTSFPDSLQVPALGSADLQALRNDLARKVAEARSPGTDKTSAQPVSATLTHTANQAATYASSGSARVDLFFRYKGSDTLACTPSGQIDHLLHQVLSLLPSYCVHDKLWFAWLLQGPVMLLAGLARGFNRYPETDGSPARRQRWQG